MNENINLFIELLDSLNKLNLEQIKILRKENEAYDKLFINIFKLIDLDTVRKKAIKKYIRLEKKKENDKLLKFKKKNKSKTNNNLTRCYVCKVKKQLTEPDKICNDCIIKTETYFNYNLNLEGKNIIVTGGRIKIGFYTALRLLRAKANVLITTRFPLDALERYKKEEDYEDWKDKLLIYGVDFNNFTLVDNFCNYVKKKFKSIYMLVNNAAQTIKRPVQYYKHLTDFKNYKSLTYYNSECNSSNILCLNNDVIIDNLSDYKKCEDNDFPVNEYDIDGQQLDLRMNNSWTESNKEINIKECVETQVINSIVPFYLIQQFEELFNNSFILNITSQEGRFDQKKKSNMHLHNNMSKASLNMITKTIGDDYYNRLKTQVISIDVGWANSMIGPTQKGLLDYNDCVARILQPLIDKKNYSASQLRHFKNVGF
jgi:NAD(P)-dependent dehydrogenase (short-subunit alcohol dehydrogenase family)